MKVIATPIAGLYVIDIVPHGDERGLFARTWDSGVAAEHGLTERFDYSCISTNHKQFTLRGMHWQQNPYDETKLVRCTRGKAFDVAVDLRPDSATFKQWYGTELSAENHRALYIPAGCAHGFLTLAPDTEILYDIAGTYMPDASQGVRWNDPAFAIAWPASPVVISERDTAYPDYAL